MPRYVSLLRRWLPVLVTFVAASSACAQQDTSLPNDWPTASTTEVGLDPVLIDGLLSAVRNDAFPNLHSIVLIKDGRLVVDEYFGEFDAETRHYTASVTKSVVSILLGIAMDRGLLPGLEDGVLDLRLPELFPEYRDVLDGDSEKANIRMRHILSMSAGLAWDEKSDPYDDPRNDWVRVRGEPDPVRLVLQQPVAHEPGEVFNYSGGLSTLLGYLLEREAGMEATTFAERHLFGPLGITDYEWWDLQGGLIDAPGGLNLRPRDMAKLGQLFLNGGTWRGRRVVSEDWVAASTRIQIEIDRSPDYAFQWWCGDFYYRGRHVFVYMASGHGGQKIFVVPDFDLVAVLTHQVFDNPAGELHNTSIMSRYILPAADSTAVQVQVTAMDATALAAYTGAFVTVRDSTDRFTIDLRDGKLYATAPNTPVIELAPVTALRFRGTVADLIDVDFFFEVTADGHVTRGRTAYGFRNDRFVREGR